MAEATPAMSTSLKKLGSILESHSHLFSCSGSLPIAVDEKMGEKTEEKEKEEEGKEEEKGKEEVTYDGKPVTLRWDLPAAEEGSSSPVSCGKITLPLAQGHDDDLKRLLESTKPATFGRGEKSVYDETYRKALAMGPDRFSTTFDPYSLGIVDTVAQVLLPSVIDSTTRRSVRAELYNMNVYTGPSGKFKAHLDTPRSTDQFGSLVVCLPLSHKGGELKVRHKGQEITYDWAATSDTPSIQWAAFYSDCEHEVLEVTSGHRMTLTYNLYAAVGAGRMTGMGLALDPLHLPIYEAVKEALSKDPYEGRGGGVGFWCSHVYPFTHKTESPFPAVLKGVDAVLWESLSALGLQPVVKPVIDLENWYGYDWYARERKRANKPVYQMVFGKSMRVLVTDWLSEDDKSFFEILDSWGKVVTQPFTWLAKRPSISELQMSYVTYGNEPSISSLYSHCAICVIFPEKDAAKEVAE